MNHKEELLRGLWVAFKRRQMARTSRTPGSWMHWDADSMILGAPSSDSGVFGGISSLGLGGGTSSLTPLNPCIGRPQNLPCPKPLKPKP